MLVGVYVSAFPYHPGLRSPNELCRLLQARAIVDFGDLDLNRAIQVYGPVGDLSVYRGRYYPSKAPLMSFAAVPIYFALRSALGGAPTPVPDLTLVYFARLFLTVIPTLLTLVWIRRFLRIYVSPASADAVTLTYALGTLAFSYSLLFMSHQPSAVLIFGAFYGLWRWSRGEASTLTLLFSGCLASAAVLAEYTSTIAVVGIGLYGFLVLRFQRVPPSRGLSATLLFVAGAIPLTLLLMCYHSRAFGGPFESGYRHLADAAYQPWHQGGFLGIGLPRARAFVLSFFSPLRGLFALSPALLLAVPGLILLFNRARDDTSLKPLAWATLAIVAAYTYFTSAFSYESWGWTTGPRHLSALMPFLLLPVALTVERARSTRLRGACAVLLAASVLFTSALTFINYIPDDVSNALGALASPLTQTGYLTPSVLCAFGLTNPLAGIVLWIGVAAIASWLVWSLRPNGSVLPWIAVISTAAALALFQVMTFSDSPSDRAAFALLRRVWLAPPGHSLHLLP